MLTWPTYPRAVADMSFSFLSLACPDNFFPGSDNAMPAMIKDEPSLFTASLSTPAQIWEEDRIRRLLSEGVIHWLHYFAKHNPRGLIIRVQRKEDVPLKKQKKRNL